MINREDISDSYRLIQDRICAHLELVDGGALFEEEHWSRDGGGGGRTRIIQNGNVFERGGVNFSAVHGTLPDTIRKAFQVDEDQFFATGVSIVLHPVNPWVPIIHMNIRYFELNEKVRWFGGGIDLTPHYVIPEDARYFHGELKKICDRYSTDFYPKFKGMADKYFFIKHRKETRGVGGIFYDRLRDSGEGISDESIFSFSQDLGNRFADIYGELVSRNRDRPFGQRQLDWQALRRSRYVEFNLVYDSGTKFGLETNGRTESILMSLPPMAKWHYNYQPETGSAEAESLSWLKKGVDWVEAF